MEVDDVVDLSIGTGRETLTMNSATARDLRALTQNSGLTITPAPPPMVQQQPPLQQHQMQQQSSQIEEGIFMNKIVNILFCSK